MVVIWGLIMGIPLLAFGGGALISPSSVSQFVEWFRTSRRMALILTVFAWFWTAYECDTIGIDVFDKFLKAFPMELPILAIVLTVLIAGVAAALFPVKTVSETQS